MSGGGRKGGGGVRQRVVVPLPSPPRYNAVSPSLPRSLLPSFRPSHLQPSPGRSGCVRAGGVPYHSHCTGSRGLEVCAVGGREGGAGRLAGRVGDTMCSWVWEPFSRKCRSPARVCDKIGIGASGLGVSASLSLSAVRSSHKGEPNGGKRQSVFVQKSWLTGRLQFGAQVFVSAAAKKKKKKKTAQEFTRCFNRTLQNFYFFFSQRACKTWKEVSVASDDTWLLLSVCPAIPAVTMGGKIVQLFTFFFFPLSTIYGNAERFVGFVGSV